MSGRIPIGAPGVLVTLLLLLLASACSENGGRAAGGVRFFAPDAYPQKLSDWGLIEISGSHLGLADGVEPYDLNAPLFTDYAQKLRAIYLPTGSAASYQPEEAFDFPVGTIIAVYML